MIDHDDSDEEEEEEEEEEDKDDDDDDDDGNGCSTHDERDVFAAFPASWLPRALRGGHYHIGYPRDNQRPIAPLACFCLTRWFQPASAQNWT